jgi:hypothetical protein
MEVRRLGNREMLDFLISSSSHLHITHPPFGLIPDFERIPINAKRIKRKQDTNPNQIGYSQTETETTLY